MATPYRSPRDLALGDAFLTQLRSINVRSRGVPNTLIKMLSSQEGVNTAMLLQDDDASALVDILDQVSGPRIIRAHRLTPRTGL